MKRKTVALLIGNTRYPVTDKGEGTLKRRLYAKYTATTPVEVWIDGKLSTIDTLEGVFNKLKWNDTKNYKMDSELGKSRL